MAANLDSPTVPLDRTTVLSLRRARGSTIRCVHGHLWITCDGSWADVHLTPGQAYRIDGPMRVIVTAFGPSVAQVSGPTSRPRPALWSGLGAALERLAARVAGQPLSHPVAAAAE